MNATAGLAARIGARLIDQGSDPGVALAQAQGILDEIATTHEIDVKPTDFMGDRLPIPPEVLNEPGWYEIARVFEAKVEVPPGDRQPYRTMIATSERGADNPNRWIGPLSNLVNAAAETCLEALPAEIAAETPQITADDMSSALICAIALGLGPDTLKATQARMSALVESLPHVLGESGHEGLLPIPPGMGDHAGARQIMTVWQVPGGNCPDCGGEHPEKVVPGMVLDALTPQQWGEVLASVTLILVEHGPGEADTKREAILGAYTNALIAHETSDEPAASPKGRH